MHNIQHDLVIQQSSAQPCTQLILLFHGVGAMPLDMVPLGVRLAQAFPAAFVVSVAGANDSTLGQGREWFSVVGISEANRAARVEGALPAFAAAVAHWQRESGVTPHGTALVGFSQGAIMALASTQPHDESTQHATPLAARIVALAGRFAAMPPQPVPSATTLHLVHGKQDAVIPYSFTVQAAEHLVAHGADLTADVIPFLGHTVSEDVIDLVVQRLSTHVPKRLWDEALRSAPD